MAITATRGSKAVIVLFLLILGTTFIFVGWRDRNMVVASQSWPAAQAQVTTSRAFLSGSRWHTNIRCVLLETGAHFDLKRTSYGHKYNATASPKKQAEALVNKYHSGFTFTAYVCPEDNSNVITEKTYTTHYETTILCVGIALLIMALAFCFTRVTAPSTTENT